jgi:hypothetical protein
MDSTIGNNLEIPLPSRPLTYKCPCCNHIVDLNKGGLAEAVSFGSILERIQETGNEKEARDRRPLQTNGKGRYFGQGILVLRVG